MYFSYLCCETLANCTLLELLPLFCSAKVSLSLSSILGIILPFLALSTSLLSGMGMLHQLCGLLSACQQLRCLVCYALVCSWSVRRSHTVSLPYHLLVCSYRLAVFENQYLLRITQWTITPTLSWCHRCYCFSSLSSHNLHRGETSGNFVIYAVCSQCLVLHSHEHSLCFFFQRSYL